MGGTDNNDSDDSDVYNESSARRIANEKKTNVLVKSLLSSTINRASRTMSNLSNNDDDGGSGSGSGNGSGNGNGSDGFTTSQNDSTENGIQNLMETVISRSSNNNDNDNNNNNNDSVVTKVVESKDKGSACSIIGKADKKQHQDKRQYLANPAVTPTALAHSLWAEVIQPYTDTVIDATCGNGKDALILANLLFPSHHHHQQQQLDMDTDMDNNEIQHPQLIGIDIQRQACENTVRLLNDNLPSQIVSDNIKILHSSHAPLSIPLSTASVGLICYNLGYLPGTDNKRVSTEMMTTLYSITDAALMLRLGGLLSIMTYPGSSYLEYCAVSYFVEGLAMFTSKNDWRDFVDSVPNDEELLRQADARHGSYNHKDNDEGLSESSTVRDCVKIALKRVMDKGDKKQTWRSFDHRPLGRPYSPILFTAMRIK
jgi:hypothetical protein